MFSLSNLCKAFSSTSLLSSFSKNTVSHAIQKNVAPKSLVRRYCTFLNRTIPSKTINSNTALFNKANEVYIPQRTYESYSFVSELSHFLKRRIKYGLPEFRRKRIGATEGKPFIKGVVLKTLIKKPKKPNSANRKCVRVRLSTGKEATAYVPGIGHNLQEHHIVLVKGGKTQDLPGVKLTCVRGAYDLGHVKKPK
ncbi:hypothetical protein HELRODRAFT_168519 [Helobdella robusta]|uniref:Small ribosomal subunit protein uS12m n=1 Tax=Helobdella robusta TaxID=6412 RepID=T1F0N5_HELRO|nr:hypothetical protein HELRODRAFT_168519 [Helobdella robusta]ESO09524.1 hypothetical protein HELRODRAFT_168519 [Helobdella robusta]